MPSSPLSGPFSTAKKRRFSTNGRARKCERGASSSFGDNTILSTILACPLFVDKSKTWTNDVDHHAEVDADRCSVLKPISLTVVVRNGDRHRIGTAPRTAVEKGSPLK